jgi:hypothetical protein
MANEDEKKKTTKEIKAAAGTKGGRARAEALSPAERSEIASKAAAARWSPTPRATHSGILKIADLSIPVFVLDDSTRVISGRGFTNALGLKGRGQGMTRISAHRTLKEFMSHDLTMAIEKPLVFTRPDGGKPTHGYGATLLVQVADAILRARDAGALKTEQEVRYAMACDVLVRSFAQVGIIALVDEATGYQEVRPRDALEKYLELIVRKELAVWTKKFPDEFYENIYKLKGWPWPGMSKNRYSVVAQYTRDLVFERLAPGLLAKLEVKSPRNEKGSRPNKLHQWLTEDIGDPMLKQHLHSLVMFQRLAIANGYGWHRFVKMVDKVLPRKGATLELPFPDSD